jgi:hypothetical protein
LHLFDIFKYSFKKDRQYAGRWSMLITAAMCIPYIFIFMESIANSLFRNRKGPSIIDVMIVFLVEGLHSFGLCLLVFRVLPSCDVIRAVLLMNCVCIVPGFCKMIFAKNSAGPVGKILIFLLDLLALICQITVFFVIIGSEYTAFIEKAMYAPSTTTTAMPVGDTNGGGFPMDDTGVQSDPFADAAGVVKRQISDMPLLDDKPKWKGSWEAPIALLFTSIIWWENYVDRDIKILCFNVPLGSYKRHLQAVRSKVNIGASLWKIVLTITFNFLLLPSKNFENSFVKMPSSVSSPGGSLPNGGVPPTPGVIDFGGFDLPVDQNEQAARRMFKRDAGDDNVLMTSTPQMASYAMQLESLLTVPNNVWITPTTPNLFDFVPSKVKFD